MSPLSHPGGRIASSSSWDHRGFLQNCVWRRCWVGVGSERRPPHPHTAGCGLGHVGESRTGGAGDVHCGPACRSVAAGFSLHSLLPPGSCRAGKHYCPRRPACFLLFPVITAARPRVSLSSAVLLVSPSRRHSPSAEQQLLGETGVLGCAVGVLPMLCCTELRAVGSRVVGLGYFGLGCNQHP